MQTMTAIVITSVQDKEKDENNFFIFLSLIMRWLKMDDDTLKCKNELDLEFKEARISYWEEYHKLFPGAP